MQFTTGFYLVVPGWGVRIIIKGVGPGPTLAWPGWRQPDIPVEVDTRASSKNVMQTVSYSTSLVLNSRVLLMYTDTVEELPGYPVQNSPSGSFLF